MEGVLGKWEKGRIPSRRKAPEEIISKSSLCFRHSESRQVEILTLDLLTTDTRMRETGNRKKVFKRTSNEEARKKERKKERKGKLPSCSPLKPPPPTSSPQDR